MYIIGIGFYGNPCVPKDLTVILVFSCQAYTYAESLQCVITKICSRIKIAISACITIASMFTQNSYQKRKKNQSKFDLFMVHGNS